jgi:hypothetical protein
MLMVHVDEVAVAMALEHMPVRVPVRLRALPALVLVPVVLVLHVQMRVLDWRMLMLVAVHSFETSHLHQAA